jgi:hypothetical protein
MNLFQTEMNQALPISKPQNPPDPWHRRYGFTEEGDWTRLPSFWTKRARCPVTRKKIPLWRIAGVEIHWENLGTQLLRGNTEHAFEVSGQMALIRKAHGRGDLRQRAITRSCCQQRTGAVNPHLHKILMG